MNALVAGTLPFLLLYKYWAIFAITLIASLAFPIPPGTLLMASAAFASQGYFSFPFVVISGTLGNLVGDNIGYWLARRYGKAILCKIGFRKSIESDRYKAIEARVRKNPGFLIFITRFEVFSNLAVNLIAGLSEVPYTKYLLFEVPGEILQVLIYCSIGYFVGDNWTLFSTLLNRLMVIILLVAVLLVVVFWKRITRFLNRTSK